MMGANQQQARSELAHLRERASQVWSEGALRLVFERSRDAILLLDDGVFIDCNQAAVDMLRAAGSDELLSLSPSDLSPVTQPDGTSSSIKAQQMIAVALERGSHRFEWLAKRRNGSEFPVEIRLTAIPFQERQILYVVWRDISRRNEAERELAKSREPDDAFRAGQGSLNKQIAHQLGTSERTIKAHRAQVVQKMKADSVADLVRMADRLKIAPQRSVKSTSAP